MVKYNNNNYIILIRNYCRLSHDVVTCDMNIDVSTAYRKSGHVWYESRRSDCIPQVFIRRWGRLVSDVLIKQDASLWLVGSPITAKHDSGPPRKHLTNSEDRNAPITAVKKPITAKHPAISVRTPETSLPHRLMKTSSIMYAVETSRFTRDHIVRQTIIVHY